jgi:hypothetical protein
MILTGKYSFPCIIPHCLITVIYTIACFLRLFALYVQLFTAYMHIYMLLLYGVAIPPRLLSLMLFVECEQVTGLRQRLLRFSYALQLAHVPELEPDVIPDI